jgi:hypothetical protein
VEGGGVLGADQPSAARQRRWEAQRDEDLERLRVRGFLVKGLLGGGHEALEGLRAAALARTVPWLPARTFLDRLPLLPRLGGHEPCRVGFKGSARRAVGGTCVTSGLASAMAPPYACVVGRHHVLIAGAVVAIAACSASPAATPKVIYVTPVPASAPTPMVIYVTPAPIVAPTPIVIYVTPAPAIVPTATPTPIPAPTKTPKPTPHAREFGNGTWIVGQDIQPGTYRTREASGNCYWERLSGLSGNFGDIIANDGISYPTVVTIAPTDKAFESSGCATWTSDLSQVTASKTTFGDGVWIVGVDISPGTYERTGGGDCYWERLSGFSGTFGDIIANSFAGATIVTIARTDRGFKSEHCGTWTRG